MSVTQRVQPVPPPFKEPCGRDGRPSERVTLGSGAGLQACHIRKVPDTVLSYIISHMHVRDQVGVAELVSHTWRRAARLLPQSTLDFHQGSQQSQVQVSIEMASRLVSRAVRISNSQQRPGSRMINPITFINLAGCSGIPGQSDAQLVAYCIQLCPNLRELQACRTSNGRAKATLPLSADGALQVLRACKTHTKIKSVRIDVEAYSLSDTWETTSYQRAIGVEPLWDTFLMLLQKSSQIRINQLMFVGYRVSGHARSSVTPSEHGKVTTSRAKDLAAALAGNTSVCGLIIPGGYLASAALEAICTAAKARPGINTLELHGRPLYGNITEDQLARGL